MSFVAARSAGAVCSSRPSAGRCLACVGFKSTFEFDVEFRIAVLKVRSAGIGSRDLRSVSSPPSTGVNRGQVRALAGVDMRVLRGVTSLFWGVITALINAAKTHA